MLAGEPMTPALELRQLTKAFELGSGMKPLFGGQAKKTHCGRWCEYKR